MLLSLEFSLSLLSHFLHWTCSSLPKSPLVLLLSVDPCLIPEMFQWAPLKSYLYLRFVPAFLALGKLRQKGCHEFEASLGYITSTKQSQGYVGKILSQKIKFLW